MASSSSSQPPPPPPYIPTTPSNPNPNPNSNQPLQPKSNPYSKSLPISKQTLHHISALTTSHREMYLSPFLSEDESGVGEGEVKEKERLYYVHFSPVENGWHMRLFKRVVGESEEEGVKKGDGKEKEKEKGKLIARLMFSEKKKSIDIEYIDIETTDNNNDNNNNNKTISLKDIAPTSPSSQTTSSPTATSIPITIHGQSYAWQETPAYIEMETSLENDGEKSKNKNKNKAPPKHRILGTAELLNTSTNTVIATFTNTANASQLSTVKLPTSQGSKDGEDKLGVLEWKDVDGVEEDTIDALTVVFLGLVERYWFFKGVKARKVAGAVADFGILLCAVC